MTQITLAELPQNLQTLLNQAQKTGEPLTIIQKFKTVYNNSIQKKPPYVMILPF